jgi:hypothetical protein
LSRKRDSHAAAADHAVVRGMRDVVVLKTVIGPDVDTLRTGNWFNDEERFKD